MLFVVYILHSEKLQQFYVGTTDHFAGRLAQHNNGAFGRKAYTFKGIPWTMYLVIDQLKSGQAYAIEKHIKSMKSNKYIENLKAFPEMVEKLKNRYS